MTMEGCVYFVTDEQGLGALLVLYSYCFVWQIMKTLVNGVWLPLLINETKVREIN